MPKLQVSDEKGDDPPKESLEDETQEESMQQVIDKKGEAQQSLTAREAQSDGKEEQGPNIKKFQNRWLAMFQWLEFDEDRNLMTCSLCVKAGFTNTMTEGTKNFRTSTLTRHVKSSDHQRTLALNKPAQQNLKKTLANAVTAEEEAVVAAMKVAYWLAKETIPMAKFKSLMGLLTDLGTPKIALLKLSDSDSTDYTSPDSVRDFLDSISTDLDNQVTEKLKNSPAVCLLTDESTDPRTRKKLSVMARVVDPNTMESSTEYLRDVKIETSTARGIKEALDNELAQRGMTAKDVDHLGTDGAKVMTGVKEGLTGLFLRDNPHLINSHCSAHRVALASSQAANNIPQVKEFSHTMEMIYYHFKRCPGKIDTVTAIQKILKEPELKYREVHEIRWLSCYESIQAVYRTLDSLITYLEQVGPTDPSGEGVRRKVSSVMFVGLTYSMMDILAIVTKLSLVFQKKDLDVSAAKVSIDHALTDLQDLKGDTHPLGKPSHWQTMPPEVMGGEFKGHKLSMPKTPGLLEKTRLHYIDAVIENLQARFPEAELMAAFAVLSMRPLSMVPDVNSWGNDKLEMLISHYGADKEHLFKPKDDPRAQSSRSEAKIDADEARDEWRQLKQTVLHELYPRDNMRELWVLINKYHKDQFPNMLKLAYYALTHPTHTSDCERSFSNQNAITTTRRNRLSPENIDKIMRIQIQGPLLGAYDFLPALAFWRSLRYRYIFKK